MSKVELTSKEIEDSQYFIKGAKKPELLVLVEDEQDVPFWGKMFGCVSDKYFRIHIHSLQTAPLQSNKDGKRLIGTGKENLMNVNPDTLGKSKMIAVDADILHYLQGHTLYDYVEKVVRHYFDIDYKAAEGKCKNALVGSDGKTIGNVITDLKLSIWQGKQDCIHESIYNGNAVDVADNGIVGIQNQIKAQIDAS